MLTLALVVGQLASHLLAPTSAPATTALAPLQQASVAVSLTPQPRLARYVVTGGGNEVRYRVREQLAGVSFPNDAVGVTAAVSGQVVVDQGTGQVVPADSRVTVEVGGLTSDQSRRDNYIRTRTLETATHPTVVLVATELRGLSWPLPAAGTITFELVGDLTIKGVTRPTTWSVTLDVAGDTLTGTATTAFAFSDFELPKPRVAVVLSVDDTIHLEYDLRLVRQP